MSKKEKLIEKAITSPHKIRFSELQTLLRQCGFEQLKTNAGSHMKWFHFEKKIGYNAPKKNPVKPAYIRILISKLRQHALI